MPQSKIPTWWRCQLSLGERWVLVVENPTGEDHYINVEREVWENNEIGDEITADDLPSGGGRSG